MSIRWQLPTKIHIVLAGGCWQNKYLIEKAIASFRQENFIPYWHDQIPCNDGGIAVGQIMAALTTNHQPF